MTGTRAVPLSALPALNGGHGTGQPLCPACNGGRLHPYEVTVIVPGTTGVEALVGKTLTGWVAVCKGNADYLRHPDYQEDAEGLELSPPCGFSMTLQPR